MAYIRSHCHGYLCCDMFYKSIYSTFPRNVNIFFLNPTLEYGPTHCRALLYSLQMSLPSDVSQILPPPVLRFALLPKQYACSHRYTTDCNIRAFPFTYSRCFPENPQKAMFILVQNSWGNRSNISASANQQKYHCEQTLKVKDGRLYCGNRTHWINQPRK